MVSLHHEAVFLAQCVISIIAVFCQPTNTARVLSSLPSLVWPSCMCMHRERCACTENSVCTPHDLHDYCHSVCLCCVKWRAPTRVVFVLDGLALMISISSDLLDVVHAIPGLTCATSIFCIVLYLYCIPTNVGLLGGCTRAIADKMPVTPSPLRTTSPLWSRAISCASGRCASPRLPRPATHGSVWPHACSPPLLNQMRVPPSPQAPQ